MFNDEPARARTETHAIRVCAGVLLLIITMILTRIQADGARTGFAGAGDLSGKWAHRQTCQSRMTSNVLYFTTWPSTMLASYQVRRAALNSSAPDAQFEAVSFFDLFNGASRYMTLSTPSANLTADSRAANVILHNPPAPTEWDARDAPAVSDTLGAQLRVVNLKNSRLCGERALCSLKVTHLPNAALCLASQFAIPASLKGCYRIDVIDSFTGDLLAADLALDLALGEEEMALSTLAADEFEDSLYYVTGRDVSWTLHKLNIGAGSQTTVPLPVVDENEMQRFSYVSTFNNRLGGGGSGSVRVNDVPIFGEGGSPPPARLSLQPAAALHPILVYPSNNYIAVIRAGADLGVIIHIFKKGDVGEALVSRSSVQFDHMDSAWIVQAPDSSAANYLLLMGAAPPYSWQTEAIDLASGTVETRHSYS